MYPKKQLIASLALHKTTLLVNDDALLAAESISHPLQCWVHTKAPHYITFDCTAQQIYAVGKWPSPVTTVVQPSEYTHQPLDSLKVVQPSDIRYHLK
ncbi:hypothetical protein V6N13_094491 [Hibiscus sabdariffa]|uniref:Uncharacterized protein n=2 Tax=Hibiscus sabdariffa TaxID=183260 RepID=A0ABR1ZZ42_9ROSI